MLKRLTNRIRGFTIGELLITIALIAIISTTAILVINPADLLRQARDNARITDISRLKLDMANFQGANLGSAMVSYVSIPDSAATSSAGTQCQTMGLPTLPAGWIYHCASLAAYKNTDGTGWMPVNFSQMPGGSSLGALPVDPVNSAAQGNYYTYVTDGIKNFEFAASVESKKYLGTVSSDGGKYDNLYEAGESLTLLPVDYAGGAGYTGNISQGTTYNFSGFQPPIIQDGSGVYNLGRTLPIKFYLQDSNGNYITSPTARLLVYRVQNGIIGETPVPLELFQNDTGNLFRVSGNQYIYNLRTDELSVGTWQLKASLNTGDDYSVLISLSEH